MVHEQRAAEDKGNKDLQREVSAQLAKLQKLKAELAAQKEAAALQCAPSCCFAANFLIPTLSASHPAAS